MRHSKRDSWAEFPFLPIRNAQWELSHWLTSLNWPKGSRELHKVASLAILWTVKRCFFTLFVTTLSTLRHCLGLGQNVNHHSYSFLAKTHELTYSRVSHT